MYSNAVGFNPGQSLLGGLRTRGAAAPFAKGQAMASAAGLNLEAAKQDQQLGMQDMENQSQQRMANARNQAQKAGNETQERIQRGGLANRSAAFDLGTRFDYAGLQKRKQMQWQQALLNNFAREV